MDVKQLEEEKQKHKGLRYKGVWKMKKMKEDQQFWSEAREAVT